MNKGECQQLFFNNVTDHIGLPAQESYNVMQDSKGFIWISTEAGLCRYNGSSSLIFDKKNGLPENSCYSVNEDEKGGIWMITSSNRIMRYVNNSLKEASFSKSFSSQFFGTLSQAYLLNFRNDSAIISTQNITLISGVNSTVTTNLKIETSVDYYFMKSKNLLMNIKNENSAAVINNIIKKGIITIGINTGSEIKQISIKYDSKDQPTWRVLTTCNKKGESFIGIGRILLKLNEDLSYEVIHLQNEILSLYNDEDGGLWVGVLKSGVDYYPNTNVMNEKLLNMEGLSVTGICVDKENGVWCTTLEKGIFYCLNKNVINYSNNKGLNKPADFLKCENDRVFTSSGQNELIELNKDGVIKHEFNILNNKSLSDIVKDENGWIIAGKSIILKTTEKFTNPIYIKAGIHGFHSGASQLTSTNNKSFGIHFGNILEIIGDKSVDIKSPLESAGRCIQSINNSILLYGCKNGLYKIFLDSSPTHKMYETKKIVGLDGPVTKIIKSSTGDIWITTKEDGIYTYKKDNIVNLTYVLKLPTERFFDITEDKFKTIWLGTNLGLIKLSIKSKSDNSFKLYNTLNGLPSNEVFKVATDSSYIYFSTIEGVSKFSLNAELTNSAPPNIYLNSLKVNGELFSDKTNLCFSYNNNSLRIELNALTFKDINNPNLHYILKEIPSQKIHKEETIKGNIISLNDIPSSKYELVIYALNNDNIKSIKPVVLYFEIEKPFWQSIFFIIACVFCLGLIIFISIKIITGNIRRKEEEKTAINKQLAEFQLTALQAQMNPHFIFNAINSIQNYVLRKQEQEAYNYLTKFSKLIRMVLNNSEHKTLSIHDELEAVKLYIELEQLRFKKKFEFTLEIDHNINEDHIHIPAMLIQPYIENAIWHGLMNLNDERIGKIKLSIYLEEKLLKICIEDNGIGREQAGNYKKESIHKPIAMKLTEKRLSIINTMQNYVGVRILVSDLKNKLNEASGTRVEIFLPIS